MAIPILSDIGKALSGFFVGKPGGIQYPIGASVTGGGMAEGKPSGFSQLFSNPLFISMLSGVGASLNPRMAGINAMVQKALGGQALGKATNEKDNEFVTQVGRLLKGEPVEGFTYTRNDKGTTISYKRPEGGGGVDVSGGDGQGTQATNTQNVDVGYANPFGSGLSNLSAADLAVLGPEGVAQALSYDLNRDQLLASIYNDLLTRRQAERNMDIMEKYYTGQNAVAQKNADRLWNESMRTAPINVPGLGEINLDTWKSLPDKVKAYSYYVYDQMQNGRAPLVYDAWDQQTDDPILKKYYDLAEDDPGFKDFLFKYAKAGSSTINLGPYGTAVEGGRGRGRAQLYDAEGLDKEIMATDRMSNFGLMFDENDRATYLNEKAKAATEIIYSKVAADTGSKITGPTISGNTLTFKIIWSDGSKEDYNYVVK